MIGLIPVSLSLGALVFGALVLCVVAMLGGYSLGRTSVEPRLVQERAKLWRAWRNTCERAAQRFRYRGRPVRASIIEDAIAAMLADRGKPGAIFSPTFALA